MMGTDIRKHQLDHLIQRMNVIISDSTVNPEDRKHLQLYAIDRFQSLDSVNQHFDEDQNKRTYKEWKERLGL